MGWSSLGQKMWNLSWTLMTTNHLQLQWNDLGEAGKAVRGWRPVNSTAFVGPNFPAEWFLESTRDTHEPESGGPWIGCMVNSSVLSISPHVKLLFFHGRSKYIDMPQLISEAASTSRQHLSSWNVSTSLRTSLPLQTASLSWHTCGLPRVIKLPREHLCSSPQNRD